MKPAQVKLVQQSFEQVAPIADAAAAMFYERLFTLDPSVRALFTGDMKKQGQMLMQTIGLAVKSLDQPEKILSAVQNLGRRHASYGVRDSHYDTVGSALLWTLEQGLGAGFTPPVRAAWTETYLLLANVMKEAAQPKAA
jgi:hemoglobin-like flavoprotein